MDLPGRQPFFHDLIDGRNAKIGKKLREAQLEKILYMLVVGDRDMEAGTVSVRHRAEGDLSAMSLNEFIAILRRAVNTIAKSWLAFLRVTTEPPQGGTLLRRL